MMKKILVFSSQSVGGCFIYADKIISNFKSDVEIVIPEKVYEACNTTPDWTYKFYGCNFLIRILSSIVVLIKILRRSISGKYDSLLLFGITKLDYYILCIWKVFNGKSYLVIHDGKMHKGEEDETFVRQTIKMIKLSTAVIFLSEYVRNLTFSNFGIDKPSIIAPHGLIDYGLLENLHKDIKHKPKLLFLGRISKYKGIELLLEALEYVDSSLYEDVVIAGKWTYTIPEIPSKLKVKMIDKWLSDKEIINLISSSDIMLFPYLEASQSGVATVAINYLKPSIVTTVGAFKEQFVGETAVFTEPKPLDLANAITELCKNQELRMSIINNLKLLREKYSWENIANNLEVAIRTQF